MPATPPQTAVPLPLHSPALRTLMPCFAATDSFQYVTPSQPQTGLLTNVSAVPIGTQVPLPQLLVLQYLPGPHGSGIAQLQLPSLPESRPESRPVPESKSDPASSHV